MPIERQVWPRDFSKRQLEELLACGRDLEGAVFLDLATECGIVCEVYDDAVYVSSGGTRFTWQTLMTTLWARVSPVVKAYFYIGYIHRAEQYLRKTREALRDETADVDLAAQLEHGDADAVSRSLWGAVAKQLENI